MAVCIGELLLGRVVIITVYYSLTVLPGCTCRSPVVHYVLSLGSRYGAWGSATASTGNLMQLRALDWDVEGPFKVRER